MPQPGGLSHSLESWLLVFELFLSAAWLHYQQVEWVHQREKFQKLWEGGRSWRVLLALSFRGAEEVSRHTHPTFFFSSVCSQEQEQKPRKQWAVVSSS